MNERHAVFATTESGLAFRIGLPVDWNTAQARWSRLTPQPTTPTGIVRYLRRKYRIRFYEVRAVDRHGRGLGSERHWEAIPVPYRAHRVAGK